MIYTEDRETFEREFFKPPHLARMLEAAGRYSGKMVERDRETFFKAALDAFWELRDGVHISPDIQRNWEFALKAAALSRKLWRVWNQLELRYESVAGKHLGRR